MKCQILLSNYGKTKTLATVQRTYRCISGYACEESLRLSWMVSQLKTHYGFDDHPALSGQQMFQAFELINLAKTPGS